MLLRQGELASAQEALKAARSESSRRLRELQALQAGSQPPGATGAASAAALATETAAREAAEVKLREVKAAHTRKKQLVVDLRKRVRPQNRCRSVLQLGQTLRQPLSATACRRAHVWDASSIP